MKIFDARRATRWVVDPPLPARLGRTAISICDFGEAGLQIEHDEALTTKRAPLRWTVDGAGVTLELESEVLWTRLLPSVTEPPRYRYRSGIGIGERDARAVRLTLERLVEHGSARLDADSLERKRRVVESRAEARADSAPELAATTEAKILAVHSGLAREPENLRRWEAIGRKRLPVPSGAGATAEVIAVWEALDHEFEIDTIARILGARTT